MIHPSRSIRRSTVSCAVLVIGGLAACSDQPTAPVASAPIAASREFSPAGSSAATLAWEATARHMVATHPTTVSPIVAGRVYALVAVAQYGAVVAADEGADAPDGGRALYEARRGAVAGASASVLGALFPDSAAVFDRQLASEASAGPGGVHPQFTSGVALGRATGARVMARAATDGFSVTWDGTTPPDPLGGGWVGVKGVAPAGFQFPAMRPWFLASQRQFLPAPPPARGTAAFAAELDAVRAAMLARTADSVASANFWNLSNGTVTGLGYWDERAAEYITAHGMDERQAAHVFALVNAAAMDAVIGCWDAKYYYMQLRPSMADPTITRVPGLPGFPYGLPNHPSYPSGHSCVSASAARVIAEFFPESAAPLATQVAAAGRSRIIGGIHYPIDVTAGQTLGREVAEWAIAYDAQPGGLLRALP